MRTADTLAEPVVTRINLVLPLPLATAIERYRTSRMDEPPLTQVMRELLIKGLQAEGKLP